MAAHPGLAGIAATPQEPFFNALREAIDEEMARDPYVCVMGEDVGHGGSYKVTKDLGEKYAIWVLDTLIAENGFTGMAVGAAIGLRPIVEGMNMAFCCSPSTRSPTTWGC